MTVKELYERAKSLMFEKQSSKDYDNYYIPWTNVLLSENFDLENSLLLRDGEDALDEIPMVTSDTDELPYHDVINYEILPYGLAANFFIDDDLSKYDIFHTYYQNAQMKYMKGNEVSITDVYGD
jgi:hypothetical protein|nr:MAG TPA: hypothetical protein [Caudoviricetes sp.]DAM56439.1 MAG TPA: hypothetical protein [Caudoviricetes sp.]